MIFDLLMIFDLSLIFAHYLECVRHIEGVRNRQIRVGASPILFPLQLHLFRVQLKLEIDRYRTIRILQIP